MRKVDGGKLNKVGIVDQACRLAITLVVVEG